MIGFYLENLQFSRGEGSDTFNLAVWMPQLPLMKEGSVTYPTEPLSKKVLTICYEIPGSFSGLEISVRLEAPFAV